jgi:hypothetical protein
MPWITQARISISRLGAAPRGGGEREDDDAREQEALAAERGAQPRGDRGTIAFEIR